MEGEVEINPERALDILAVQFVESVNAENAFHDVLNWCDLIIRFNTVVRDSSLGRTELKFNFTALVNELLLQRKDAIFDPDVIDFCKGFANNMFTESRWKEAEKLAIGENVNAPPVNDTKDKSPYDQENETEEVLSVDYFAIFDESQRADRKKRKYESKFAKMLKTLASADLADTIHLPAGLADNMTSVHAVIKQACKLLDINIKVDKNIVITPNSVLARDVWKEDSAAAFASLTDENTKKAVISLITLLSGIENITASNRLPTNVGSTTIQRLYAIKWQKIVYMNDYKQIDRSLTGNADSATEFKRLVSRLCPSIPTFGEIIYDAVSTIVEHSIIKIHNLANDEQELYDEIESIIKTYYISASGLINRCYHRVPKQKLKAAAKERKNRNPKYKPKDDDYETYTAISKPSISHEKKITSPQETVKIKEVNRSLQRLDKHLEGQVVSMNYADNIANIVEAITLAHTKCKAIEKTLTARKQEAYDSMREALDEDVDLDEWYPTSSAWNTAIAQLWSNGTYVSVEETLDQQFGYSSLE